MSHSDKQSGDSIRDDIKHLIEHLEHVLPGQAPIKDFVHHNTLHGYQHLKFPEALAEAEKVTGVHGYLPESEFRKLLKQDRITTQDLEAIIDKTPELAADKLLIELDGFGLTRKRVYLAALGNPIVPIKPCQLAWQLEEHQAFGHFQRDVPDGMRLQILNRAGNQSEREAVRQLADACLHALGLDHEAVHPEELLDLGTEQAEQILEQLNPDDESGPEQPVIHRMVRKEAEHILQQQIDRIGVDLTMRGLLKSMTGEDLLDGVIPILIRHIGLHLDQGMAAWRQTEDGFYVNWKSNASQDLAWVLDGLDEARDELAILDDDPMDAIIHELQRMGLHKTRWAGYLERLALEIPGWSGMFLWRNNRPGYEDVLPEHVDMLDYLAVRLVLERILSQQISRKHWLLESRVDVLQAYFRNHRSEFIIRYHLFNGHLPEYLATSAQQLLSAVSVNSIDYPKWIRLSDQLWTWRHSPAADRPVSRSVYRHAWPLFRLMQHLGLCTEDVEKLKTEHIDNIFDCLTRLTKNMRGHIWLRAYERNYQEKLFNVLKLNHGRGRWQKRITRPDAQIVFCMDDREEGFRRHLEEHNPAIETLGAAGFFGVAINWRGLDDKTVTPLCPVVVTPAHTVHEQAQQHEHKQCSNHKQRQHKRLWIQNLLHQELRRNIISSAIMILLLAPLSLLTLTGKTFAPRATTKLINWLRGAFDLKVNTEALITTSEPEQEATIENPRLGFTDEEQADRVENFLRTIGLVDGFSCLPVMMGHGSGSQNNPHLAAYDCGACSGRHGGPNARVFAAMANRPEIRTLLKQRNIVIPDDTWFLGAEHNTCDESINWYDIDSLPENLSSNFAVLKQDIAVAIKGSAHERCRRLASAPKNPGHEQALRHVIGRSMDFSQARPELGHATNATALIGRRSLSQGAFFDRRSFLISYDPSLDPEGLVLERILLAAGPVGAGINLEYYFSTINNDAYGCGSKITHNVTGMFGVMEGASSDLRTGLPKQMIEIHEAMRLLVVVEARTEILAQIYGRQPELQELIGNGWLLLAAIDPDNGEINMFEPAEGFVPWDKTLTELPMVDKSSDWYQGHDGPLPFALIKEVQHG